MEDNRRPIYSKTEQQRVISVANGLWQLQQSGAGAGSRERDPWFNRGQPQSRDDALKNMGA